MFTGNALHQIHDQLIVVIGQIGILKDGSKLKLVWGNFIVSGFGRYTQLVAFYLQLFQESSNTGGDRAKIMIFQLLVFS